jgi:hypothetical protein
MFFDTCRPISKLLPSTSENVEEEEDCTSLQTFQNQEIEASTSRKRSRLWLEVSNDGKVSVIVLYT